MLGSSGASLRGSSKGFLVEFLGEDLRAIPLAAI